MKFNIISPDANGRIDNVLTHQMLDFMERGTGTDSVPFVPISWFPGFVFNPALLSLKKWVLCDMTEYAWDWTGQTENVLGRGVTRNFGHIADDEHAKLDAFVRDNPPFLHFKRELRAVDKSDTILPMEHLCWLDAKPLQSREHFNARPVEIMHAWGWSHPSRAILHADMFKAMTTHNVGIISDINHAEGYFKGPSPRTWIAMYAPWYARTAMPDLLAWASKSKLFASMHGAGHKCFRHMECVDTVLALQDDDLTWTFPWNHGDNCIRMRRGHEFEDIEKATHRDDLHAIYLRCQETLDRYRGRRYVNEYIIPEIAKRL